MGFLVSITIPIKTYSFCVSVRNIHFMTAGNSFIIHPASTSAFYPSLQHPITSCYSMLTTSRQVISNSFDSHFHSPHADRSDRYTRLLAHTGHVLLCAVCAYDEKTDTVSNSFFRLFSSTSHGARFSSSFHSPKNLKCVLFIPFIYLFIIWESSSRLPKRMRVDLE